MNKQDMIIEKLWNNFQKDSIKGYDNFNKIVKSDDYDGSLYVSFLRYNRGGSKTEMYKIGKLGAVRRIK